MASSGWLLALALAIKALGGVAPKAYPPRAEMLDLYKAAIEEYRFQVKLNADRSRDYFVANSAIIAAGVTVLGQARVPLLAAGVFAVGLIVSVLSILGTHTQHAYYRDRRNWTKSLERRLGYADRGLGLPTAGKHARRGPAVTTLNYVILGLLCGINLMGAAWSLWRVGHPEPTAPPAAVAPAPTAPKAPVSAVPSRATPQRP